MSEGGNDRSQRRLEGLSLGAGSKLASLDALITFEELSADQREIVDRYVRLTRDADFSGVVVAVLQGASRWDVRPLLLDTSAERRGALHLLRFADPDAFLSSQRKTLFDETLSAIHRCHESSHPRAVGAYAWGEAQGQFWIRRKLYSRTLADVFATEGALSREISPVPFAQRLIAALVAFHRSGGVHGHLCAENIAIDEEYAVLLDYCFWAVRGERASGQPWAPEVATGALPGVAADIFGLGGVLRQLLPEASVREHQSFLQAMENEDPAKRPALREVEERFVPSHRNRQSSSKILGGLPAGKVKSGKLISGSVVQEAVSQEASNPGTSSLNEGAKVAQGDMHRQQSGSSPADGATSKQGTRASFNKILVARLSKMVTSLKAKISAVPPRTVRWYALGALAALIVVGALSVWEPRSVRLVRFQEQWESADEEVRKGVVLAAVSDLDSAAQEVLIEDLLKGNARPQVRIGLIRTAFNSLWKEELTTSDRQQALAFALSPFLGEDAPTLAPLREAHPGIQLAVVGDLNFALSEGQFLDIPLQSLEQLPAPFGVAFGDLGKLGVSSMGELPARALAHIVVGNFAENAIPLFVGIESSEKDFLARVLIIAPFSDVYPPLAEEILRIMLGRDDIFSRRIEWFRSDPGSQWVATSPRDQVFSALGMMPQTKLSFEQLSDLLTFPAARVRNAAVEMLAKEFVTKRIGQTLEFLASEQNRFTRPQVVLLMSALGLRQREPQNEMVGSFLSTWFNTKPDPQTVLGLLAARREVEAGDPLNLESARYLSSKDWEASLPLLRDLVLHSEKLARALAYSRLDAALPEEAKLLEVGLKNENDVRLREQLQGKLKSAKLLSALPTPSAEALVPEEPEVVESDDEGVLDSPL